MTAYAVLHFSPPFCNLKNIAHISTMTSFCNVSWLLENYVIEASARLMTPGVSQDMHNQRIFTCTRQKARIWSVLNELRVFSPDHTKQLVHGELHISDHSVSIELKTGSYLTKQEVGLLRKL